MGLIFKERLGYATVSHNGGNRHPPSIDYDIGNAMADKVFYRCMLEVLDANIEENIQERVALMIKGKTFLRSPEGSINRVVLDNVLHVVRRDIHAKMGSRPLEVEP